MASQAVLVFDADALAMAIGGVALAIVASTLVRTGILNGVAADRMLRPRPRPLSVQV